MLPPILVGFHTFRVSKASSKRTAAHKYTLLSRQLKNVSTKDTEEWEREIMSDPKVR